MTGPVQFGLTSQELAQLQQLRGSLSDFRAMLAVLPETERLAEYNQQFNQLRLEARALLKGNFTEEVPRAITGDVSVDRRISLIVMGGVILALIGLGINAIILEDVLVNSLGCCISSGGILLVIGGFVALSVKHSRERVSNVADLRERSDLLLFEIDHRLKMSGVRLQGPYA
jgi:hypothetical protein